MLADAQIRYSHTLQMTSSQPKGECLQHQEGPALMNPTAF